MPMLQEPLGSWGPEKQQDSSANDDDIKRISDPSGSADISDGLPDDLSGCPTAAYFLPDLLPCADAIPGVSHVTPQCGQGPSASAWIPGVWDSAQ